MRDQLSDISSSLATVTSMLIGLSRKQSGRKQAIGPQLVRAITVKALAEVRQTSSDAVIKQFYRDDATLRGIVEDIGAWHVRATSSPASTAVSGWAAELVDIANYPGLLPSLSPSSVYAQLRLRGLGLVRGQAGGVRMLNRVRPTTIPPIFVGQGQPIPVRSLSLVAGPTIAPHKAATLTAFTSEMAKASVPNFEAMLKLALDEDVGAQLDAALLSNSAAVPGIAPAGLLAGVTPITASTSTDAADAAREDIVTLFSGFDPPPSDPVLIMGSAEALSLSMLYPVLAATVLVTDVLDAGQVIALDGSDFASFSGDDGEVRTDQQAMIELADNPASPDIMQGSPATSMWQSDLRNIRIIESISYGMRRPGRVATVADVSW